MSELRFSQTDLLPQWPGSALHVNLVFSSNAILLNISTIYNYQWLSKCKLCIHFAENVIIMFKIRQYSKP
jgi:hypothetical protein